MAGFRLKRNIHRRMVLWTQRLAVVGLGLAVIWNLACIGLDLEHGWWLALLLPLPGLLGWLVVQPAPRLLSKANAPKVTPQVYRFLYSAPPGWNDQRARLSLLSLIQSGISLDLIWARDGQEIGCWFITSGYQNVIEQLVQDVFQDGLLEASTCPAINQGVVILHWQPGIDIPPPAELCKLNGVEGVYFQWRSHTAAVVAIWGADATKVARQLAQPGALLPGNGPGLLSPEFIGDNPWPELPAFPSPNDYPGLSAVSRLERLAPGFRVDGDTPTLVIGRDAEQQTIGFPLPDLDGARRLQVIGQAAADVVVDLVQQAIQADRPAFVLDSQGNVTARLARLLLRELSTGKVLLCDVERPAQSKFRLNPLWLPDGDDHALLSGWPVWLRELGVTPGGLGQTTCRHTLAAVMLTALIATQRGLALDPSGLREALLTPEFLTTLPPDIVPLGCGILDDEIWQWWLAEGRQTASFDSHLRLAHLRDRLGALLELPEYSVLWKMPYLDPLTAANQGQSLLWRLPDPRGRLAAYLTSQLLALITLLTVWPADRSPLLLFLHELDVGADWIERLQALPAVRLIVSGKQVKTHQLNAGPDTNLLISRLDEASAYHIQTSLPDNIKATDLRRLPPDRLLLQRGAEICTVDVKN